MRWLWKPLLRQPPTAWPLTDSEEQCPFHHPYWTWSQRETWIFVIGSRDSGVACYHSQTYSNTHHPSDYLLSSSFIWHWHSAYLSPCQPLARDTTAIHGLNSPPNKTALYNNVYKRIFQHSEIPHSPFNSGLFPPLRRISPNSLERFMPNFIEKGNQDIPFVDGVTE